MEAVTMRSGIMFSGALQIPSRSNVPNFRNGEQVHRCRTYGSGLSVTCFAKSDGTRRTEHPDKSPLNFSAVVVPILAAAVVGGMQPNVLALEGDKFTSPEKGTETIQGLDAESPDSPVKGLLQRTKEKRAGRERNSVTPPPGQTDEARITESSPFVKSAEPESKPSPAPPVGALEEGLPSPVVYQSSPEDLIKKESEVVTEVASPKSSKTHGFLPLFMAQLLVLVGTVGGGYVFITTPDSKWTELQKAVDGYVEKATPVVEDSWAKAKPVAVQVQEQTQRFGEAAKPYVVKAWETSVPLVGKAVEACKPLLKAAQSKAAELLKRGQSDR